jgi:hypothetical protein
MNDDQLVMVCWQEISEECACQGCEGLKKENEKLKERVAKLEAILMGTPDKKKS